jgi:hypothetical protein
VPLGVLVAAIALFIIRRNCLHKAEQDEPDHSIPAVPGDITGEKSELEAGHGETFSGTGEREPDMQQAGPQVAELAGIPSTRGPATELASQRPDNTQDFDNHAIPVIPTAQHELENNEQRQRQELEANRPSNSTHERIGDLPELPAHSASEPSNAAAACNINQGTNSGKLEKLKAEEARLEAQMARIQELMELDQEREKLREEIRKLEAEDKPQ